MLSHTIDFPTGCRVAQQEFRDRFRTVEYIAAKIFSVRQARRALQQCRESTGLLQDNKEVCDTFEVAGYRHGGRDQAFHFLILLSSCARRARRLSFVISSGPPRLAKNFFQKTLPIVALSALAYLEASQQQQKEMFMSDTVTVGKRLIPLEHIALIEPFDPSASSRIQTDRSFQSRIVLIDRESVLTEISVAEFAKVSDFRQLPGDGIATNPAVQFSVETFEPQQGFNPTKAFRSRILWRDLSGNIQSKLLVTAPESVLAIAVRGEAEPPKLQAEGRPTVPVRNTRGRSRRRSIRREPEAAPQPG